MERINNLKEEQPQIAVALEAEEDLAAESERFARSLRDTLREIETPDKRRFSGKSVIDDFGIHVIDERIFEILQENILKNVEISEHGRKYSKEKILEMCKAVISMIGRIQVLLNKLKAGENLDKDRQEIMAMDSEIKKLLHSLGFAEMLVFGDWAIESPDEKITEKMGIKSLEKTETLLLQFLSKHNIVSCDPPENHDERLVHIHLGSGNGMIQERLRKKEERPFEGEGRLRNYFVELGFADKIYFFVSSLFNKFVREELREKPEVKEFIDILSSLLMRDIFYRQRSKRPEEITQESVELDDSILAVPYDINKIKKVLPRLRKYMVDGYMRQLGGKGSIPPPLEKEQRDSMEGGELRGLVELGMAKNYGIFYGDGEFIHEAKMKREVSVECRGMIGRATSDDEKRVMELWEEIFEEAFFSEDLSKHIDIRYFDFVPGRFEKMDETFKRRDQKEGLFTLAHSNKGFSHLDEEDYSTAILAVAGRLRQGGLFIDNGFIGSSWADLKLPALRHFERTIEESGHSKKFRVRFIVKEADGEEGKINGKAVIIERGVKVKGGRYVFFTDDENCRREFVAERHTLMTMEDYLVEEKAIWVALRRRAFALKLEEKIPHINNKARQAMLMGLRSLRPKIDQELKGFDKEEVQKTGVPEAMEKFFKKPEVAEILNQLERYLENVPEENLSDFYSLDDEKDEFKVESVIDDKKDYEDEHEQIRMPNPEKLEELKRKTVYTIPSMSEKYKQDDERVSYADTQREVSVGDLPRNASVPRLEAFVEKRRQIKERLERMKALMRARYGAIAEDYKPLRLIEFKGCFTNLAMRNLIEEVIGGEESAEKMIERYEIDLGRNFNANKFPPEPKPFQTLIVGGNIGDTYEMAARVFIEEYCVPFLKRIREGEPIRVFGTCFSHQSLLEAFGIIHGKKKQYQTVGGAIQFGAFPIRIPPEFSQHCAFKYMNLSERNSIFTAPFTRSGYTYMEGYEELENIKAIGYDMTGNEQSQNIPPIAVELFNGAVIATQFHPEIMLSSESHMKKLIKTIDLYVQEMQLARKSINERSRCSTYPPRHFYGNVNLRYTNGERRAEPWVINDIGPALMVGVLEKFTQDIETAMETISRDR